MLSMKDCLDYCDLTEDEVELIAEHEAIPEATAAHLACGLVQTSEGVILITQYMQDMAERALVRGDCSRAEHVMNVWRRFMSDHPLTH